MGPVMGVTVPTLNVGMLFSTSCWYRDPHGLPWYVDKDIRLNIYSILKWTLNVKFRVEYHHTGAPKLWYGVPESHGIAFYTAMKQLVPTFCRKKPIWMAPDTAMVCKYFSVFSEKEFPSTLWFLIRYRPTFSSGTMYLVAVLSKSRVNLWLYSPEPFQPSKFCCQIMFND